MKNLFLFVVAVLLIGCHVDSSSEYLFTQKWENDYARDRTGSRLQGVAKFNKVWAHVDSTFLIIDQKTGDLIKAINSGEDHFLVGSKNMLYSDGRIYMHIPRWIRCYDFETGEMIWSLDIENDLEEMILTEMSDDNNYLYIAKRGGCYIIDKDNGNLIEEFDLTDILDLESGRRDLKVRELIKTEENNLVFAVELSDSDMPDGGGFVTSINISSKEINWIFYSQTDTLSPTLRKPGITKMDLYRDYLVFLRGKYLHCLDKSSGDSIWSNQYPDLGFFFGQDISDDGVVYIGSKGWDRIVIAVNISDGSEIWRTNIGYASIHDIQVKDDLIFVVCQHLVILDRNTGEMIFDFVGSTGDFFYTPPILDDDFFIAISSQRVYGITIERTPESQ